MKIVVEGVQAGVSDNPEPARAGWGAGVAKVPLMIFHQDATQIPGTPLRKFDLVDEDAGVTYHDVYITEYKAGSLADGHIIYEGVSIVYTYMTDGG